MQIRMHAVGQDNAAFLLEGVQVMDYAGVEEEFFLQCRFINNDLNTLGLDALHHALNGGGAEVI